MSKGSIELLTLNGLLQRLGYHDTWAIEFTSADAVDPDMWWPSSFKVTLDGSAYTIETDDLETALKKAMGEHENGRA